MHRAAFDFIAARVKEHPDQARGRVLEVGSRIFHEQDATMSVRRLFPGPGEYLGIDARPGPGVDTVCVTAAGWIGGWLRSARDPLFDVVLCAEVFEHDPDWEATAKACVLVTRPGGLFVMTWATPKRAPHEVETACPEAASPYYAGVEVAHILRAIGTLPRTLHVGEDSNGEDGQAWGIR